MPANNKNNEYGNHSISSLKGAERVRLRPGVIFGSDGLEGCQHSVFEILSNAIDEAREGYGKIIEVTRYKDRSIKITDMGRGIPLDYNEKEQRYNWELVFCELYAGGKYKTNAGENYEFSLGLNGLGSCATQYSAEYMDVTVYRDGYRYDLHFEKGENIGGLKKEKCKYEHTGTIIKWKPDLEVFTDIDIPIEYFQNILKKQAVVNAGLTFILYNEVQDDTFETYEYCYQNGIVDYIKEINQDKGFTEVQLYETEKVGKDREDKPQYKVKLQVGFCFNNEINLLEYYHNSSFLEYGGSPDRAVKNAFTYVIDQYLKANNKYNKNENKITFTDIQDSLILVSNSFSTVTSYENQTKKAITNKFIQEAMTDFLKEQLEIYFIENKMEADKIVEQILINKRSRENAEKARINIKKKLSGNIDITNRVQKFVDCRTKDVNKRELYIVEGDSALGACKLGRDAEFQAIMPVRGKILNCLKADYDKIFKNDIIVDLLKVLGCGVEIKSKHNKDLHSFDINHLKWDKIIICTDADVDGYQIRTLILTMLYRLVPTLIEKDKVYIAESPLYEINSKSKTYFAYSEKEKAAILSKIKGKYTIQRSKGLGENEPEMMWQTTMNPETRRLIKVLPTDMEQTQQMFELLLGDNLKGRKDFIAKHGYKYIDMLDVS
ncbi:MAG: gyrase subunit [Clostridiales bacterium]|jgi:DNA gyrase subunit B|nr:gyrase subunit [Clostridiales bacterium]MDK2934763.1 gyrase subunit [Clostridiales bacterium]